MQLTNLDLFAGNPPHAPKHTARWLTSRWLARAVYGAASVGLAAALTLASVLPAAAGLLADGQTVRVLPFTVRDGDKPMLDATVAGKQGVVMLDNGTPDALFLNRAALPLPPGTLVGRGYAASGQAIEVRSHRAPSMKVQGQALALAAQVRSGDFGFTAPGLGSDFLGFVGTKMLTEDAFVLDYTHRQLVVLKVRKDGVLALKPPASEDVLLQIPFLIWPGGQPTFAGAVGAVPMVMDIDTGDSGTLYVTAQTREHLQDQKLLQAEGTEWRLSGVAIDSFKLAPTLVRVVDAGGPQDFRLEGHTDQLRLGAGFLTHYHCLWNFPAKTLTFLQPGASFLKQFVSAQNH